MKHLGDRLRFLVEVYLPEKWGREVTHAEVAEKVGVARQLWSRWVTNPNAPPGLDSVNRIGEALGVSKGWILFGEGGPDPVHPHTPAEVWLIHRNLEDIQKSVSNAMDAVLVLPSPAGGEA